MTGLVDVGTGALPLSQITVVEHRDAVPGRAEHYRLHHKPGSAPFELTPHDYAELLARPVQLIPAERGTNLVTVYLGADTDDEPIVDRVPILAWALCMDGQTRPVLPSGVRRGFNPESTLDYHPDYVETRESGLYQVGYDADHDRYSSTEEVIAAEIARRERYAADRWERQGAWKQGEAVPEAPQS